MPSCVICGKPFPADPRALNKRFCSREHRLEWHSKERAKVGERLAQARYLLREAEPILQGLPLGERILKWLREQEELK